MINNFKTINENCYFELVEKKSKFLANLFHVSNKEEVSKKIQSIKKLHPNAKHHVFAYRILEDTEVYDKYTDDGEPSRNCRTAHFKFTYSK